MSSLFDTVQAGDLRLANRIVMAPLTRNRAPDAIPTPLMAEYYAQRATAGLLITEATAISHQAQGYADVPGLYGTEQLDGWKKVTAAVHDEGGKIVVQLWHVGRVSHSELQPDGGQPVAPSAITAKTKTVLIQFLKNGSNQRTDDYGGPIRNRARLMLEATRAIVDAIGGGRTGIRLSPVTPANDAFDSDPQPLFEYVVKQLAKLNLAYIHLIIGATGGPRDLPERPFDYAALKAAYRTAGGKGAWMVNNGYDKASAEQALKDGADLVAFGKPFIANPDLVRRLRLDSPLNEPDKATFYGGGAEGYTDYPALSNK